MANKPVDAAIFQIKGGGYYKVPLTPLTSFTFAPDAITVKNAGGTGVIPRADYVQPPPPSPPPPVPVTGKLSGVKWTQPDAIHPQSGYGQVIGWAEPVGGIGPYVYGFKNTDGQKYRIYANTGIVDGYWAQFGPSADTITITITDARRDVAVSDPIAIRKTDGTTPVATLNSRAQIDNASADTYHYGPWLRPLVGDTAGAKWAIKSAALPTGWTYTSDFTYPAPTIAPGDYSLSWTWASVADPTKTLTLARTATVRAFTPIDAIEVVQTAPISTATPVGTIVGELRATTPTNTPVFSIAASILEVVPGTRQIRLARAATNAGPLAFSVTVTDGHATRTDQATWTVLQGETLAPEAMTLPVAKLDNSTPGQVVGTASVQGYTGGTWRVSEQPGHLLATKDQYGNPYPYQIDAKTGRITTPLDCLLSAPRPEYGWEQDQVTLVWSSDDGTKVCQRTFPIPVVEAPSVTFYVGRGMKAAHGAQGLETIGDANRLCSNFHPGKRYVFKLAQDADPDYYTDGTRAYELRMGWFGPCRVEWAEPGKRPRLGGKADNTGITGVAGTAGVSLGTGGTGYGKGHLIASHGDVEFVGLEISGAHGGGQALGREAIRKDGNTYGHLAVTDCYIHDCDQGIETGVCHGIITVQRTTVRRCGGATVGAGLTHNFYVGAMRKAVVQDCVTEEALWGHLFKCRARELIFTGNRVVDSSSAAAACCMDICNGGAALVQDNFFFKGPMAANPFAINYGAEGKLWDVNAIDVSGNTIIAGAISYGGNFGPITAVQMYPIGGKLTGDGNRVWLPPLGVLISDPLKGTFTNTSMLVTPPPIARTDPSTGATLAQLRKPYRHRQINESRRVYSPGFDGVCQETDTIDPRVAHDTRSKVFVATAMTDVDSWRNADFTLKPDPFGPGTKWAFSTARVYNSTDPAIWVKASALSVEWTEAGDATVYYEGGLAPGGYHFRLVATAADGVTTCDQRYLLAVA